jgi:hypothetical protein
MIAAM